MKKVTLQLGFIFTLCLVITDINSQDLYLIIGQSNAAGRDTNIDMNNEDAITGKVKYLTDDNRFLKARQPLNRYSGIGKDESLQGVNFGLEFGKKMNASNGNDVYLVVNARGGTKIAQWRDGKSTGYFENTVERVKNARSVCNCELKGILWHQGEGDVKNDGTYTSSYFNSLTSLIEELRDELGNAPFIVGQLYQQSKNDNFNDDIKKVDDPNFRITNVDWVNTNNLTTFDGTHFDAPSSRILGQRYASIMQQYYSNNALPVKENRGNVKNNPIISETALKVFPNPTNEIIHIAGTNGKETFEVYNLLGSKVMETKTKDLNISSLKSGTYFIIVDKSKRLQFIKE
ncbi:hypothetical protein GCM10022393_22590 [Aquimarina addita]|uniref:T9SS C-terminal target domain-containing protein n=1 Tax=Aquimarina addita TaxID=870485 RepID=A0ABP6ULR6_9FLAO